METATRTHTHVTVAVLASLGRAHEEDGPVLGHQQPVLPLVSHRQLHNLGRLDDGQLRPLAELRPALFDAKRGRSAGVEDLETDNSF